MNIEIDIDGLHCDGKLVMVWADASDLVARDKLIAEFDVPELSPEDREELEEEISDLNDKIEELKDTIAGLQSYNDCLEEKLGKLEAKLKEANDGLHKD